MLWQTPQMPFSPFWIITALRRAPEHVRDKGVPLCRSFVSVVHKPPCPYWIYYGSANATLIRMCTTMPGVVFCNIAATCGLQRNHKAFSYKRNYKTAAKGAATQQK